MNKFLALVGILGLIGLGMLTGWHVDHVITMIGGWSPGNLPGIAMLLIGGGMVVVFLYACALECLICWKEDQ